MKLTTNHSSSSLENLWYQHAERNEQAAELEQLFSSKATFRRKKESPGCTVTSEKGGGKASQDD